MSFGDIRQMLQQPQWDEEAREQFLSLVEGAYQHNRTQYKETILPYIAAFGAHFEDPIAEVTSVEQFLVSVDMLPCALWSVHTTDREIKQTRRETIEHTLRCIATLDLIIAKQSKVLEIFMQEEALTSLTQLRITSNGMNEQYIDALMRAPFMTQLIELGFADSDLDERCVKHIVSCESLTSLEMLDLSGNDVGDDGAHMIATCPFFKSLRWLNLSDSDIGPMGVRALAQSSTLPRLEALNLSFNPLTGASHASVMQLKARGVNVVI